MSNVFEVLKRMGGVVEENGVTCVTHPNPPANDDSQKIATTAWVRDITDGLEESVSGGMFPKIQTAVRNGNYSYAPSGGTWWCFLSTEAGGNYGTYINGAFAGGSRIDDFGAQSIMCIKIA